MVQFFLKCLNFRLVGTSWLLVAFVFVSSSASAEKKELIGQLSLSDILVQPQYRAIESGFAKFDLAQSYFFFSWEMNKELSGHFGVGKKGLMNRNYRLSGNTATAADDENFAFFEVYGEYNSDYGTIRAGIIPLNFGWEGTRRESEWVLPATLFFDSTSIVGSDMHDFGLRDYGVSYFVSWREFSTTIAIHNGENDKDQDGKVWHTANWGWKNNSGFEVGLSASNGKYREGTLPDVYKYSYYNSFVTYVNDDLTVLVEGTYAEESKSTDVNYKKKYWDAHADITQALGKGLSALARYELYEPDSLVLNDRTTRYILGLSINNEQKTSTLYVWGIRNDEENIAVNNDELQVVWKIRSLSVF